MEIRLGKGPEIPELYEHPGFSNALSYRTDWPVADVVAANALSEGEILGMAGASADSEAMWQIGIDVLPASRLRGVGRALVSRLTEEVLSTGALPYYAHNLTNLASAALAGSVGYRQAGVEVYARERQGSSDRVP